MSTGWNVGGLHLTVPKIINLLGNEYWLERAPRVACGTNYYKPTGK